jgi:asparagine synthase (glutamine-hydrolysing)
VLLDGQGSDETFAGYFIYYKYYLFESVLRLRPNEAVKTARVVKNRINDMFIFPAMTILSWLGFSQGSLRDLWLGRKKHLKGFEDFHLANPLADRGFDLNRALYSDLTVFSIPQLLRYEDKNSMRWSIESRVPFLDYRLVELAMSLPSPYKIHGGITKCILRKAMKGLVSDRILQRRDKIGFATPDESWLRTPEFGKLMEELFGSKEFMGRKYWRPEEVNKLLREHLNGRGDHEEDLWRIVSTELWMRAFMDGQIESLPDERSSLEKKLTETPKRIP